MQVVDHLLVRLVALLNWDWFTDHGSNWSSIRIYAENQRRWPSEKAIPSILPLPQHGLLGSAFQLTVDVVFTERINRHQPGAALDCLSDESLSSEKHKLISPRHRVQGFQTATDDDCHNLAFFLFVQHPRDGTLARIYHAGKQ
ncbi:putative parathyroid hormone 2 receptor [Trichinella spiralis]|uniref:putative parathyroid hormone 2 receptor n=1 Tax=Trichinella spiralis TaxID=6334 RepID=UPI0001EFCE2F|nr:putative parathyroid hormone 2 receptor [Trichinella spiralis]